MPLPTSALNALKRLLTLKDEAAARAAQWNSAVDAQRALPLAEVTQIPRPVTPQRMLQGVYRGYAGDDALPAEAFVAHQRPLAEHFAQRRAAQQDAAPHLDMLLVDPFAGSAPYRLHPSGVQEMSGVRKMPAAAIEGRTQLYANGGLAQLKRCSCHG